MASPDLINGIARELLQPENLPEAIDWLESRIRIHMEAGEADAVIRVGKLRDRVKVARTKMGEPKKANATK